MAYKFYTAREATVSTALEVALARINSEGWEVVSHAVSTDSVGFVEVSFIVKEKGDE